MRLSMLVLYFSLWFMRSRFLLIILAFLYTGYVHGQPPDTSRTTGRLESRLLSLTDRYGSVLNRPMLAADLAEVGALFNATYTDSLAAAQERFSNANQAFISADKGLRGVASYTDNFNGGLEELGFIYKRGFNLGVDWNALSSGFLEYKYAARQLRFQDQLNRLISQESDATVLQLTTQRIQSIFDEDINNKRRFLLQFVKEHESVARELFLNRYILWEELLKLRNSGHQLEMSIMGSSSSEKMSRKPRCFTDSLPFFQLREHEYLRQVQTRVEIDSLLKLNGQIGRYKLPYWREVNLKPYVRYNLIYYDASRARDFVSAGFMLSAPLISRKKTRHELQQTSDVELRTRVATMKKDNYWQANQLIALYRAKLSDCTATFHQGLVLEEQLRQEQIKRTSSDPDYSPLNTLSLIKLWLENDIQLTLQKKDLYLLLARMSVLTRDLSPAAYGVVYVPEVLKFSPSLKRDKSLYIWSHSFSSLELPQLAKELTNGGYNRVLLALDQNDTLKLKALDLIGLLQGKDIGVHLMMANNGWIDPKKRDQLMNDLQYNLSVPGIAGIHLDVEPHTLPVWDERRQELYRNYVSMVEAVFGGLSGKGLALSVSIPVSYDMQYLQRINRFVDRVYLMAYEHPDAAYIIRKASEEVALFRSKVTIALSVTDYQSVTAMDNLIEELEKLGGFSSFAVHDYRRLQELKSK